MSYVNNLELSVIQVIFSGHEMQLSKFIIAGTKRIEY